RSSILPSSILELAERRDEPTLRVSCPHASHLDPNHRRQPMRGHFLLCAVACLCLPAAAADDIYKLGEDSQRHEDVPRGTVTGHEWKGDIFEGTIRRYWTYVPTQYDAAEPTAVMVFQDGHAYVDEEGQFRVPVVLDNLIHKKELPVIIGIFIDPGHKRDTLPEKPGWRPRPENRSFEYDTLSDQYARFLLEEILPEVGKDYNLTDDPDRRAICGI